MQDMKSIYFRMEYRKLGIRNREQKKTRKIKIKIRNSEFGIGNQGRER